MLDSPINNRKAETIHWFQGAEERLSVSIVPTVLLPNGTLVAYRGQNVSFNCSSSSAPPSRTLSWGYWGAGPSNATLASGSGAWLGLSIPDIQPSAQGEYWCESRSDLSSRITNCSTELLVYCEWENLDFHKIKEVLKQRSLMYQM